MSTYIGKPCKKCGRRERTSNGKCVFCKSVADHQRTGIGKATYEFQKFLSSKWVKS